MRPCLLRWFWELAGSVPQTQLSPIYGSVCSAWVSRAWFSAPYRARPTVFCRWGGVGVGGQGGLRRKLLHHLHPPRKCSAEQKRSPPPPIVITPGPKSCCQSHIWRIWSIWEQHQMGWVIGVGTLKPWYIQFDNRKYRWRCAVPWNLFHSSSFLKLVDMDTH